MLKKINFQFEKNNNIDHHTYIIQLKILAPPNWLHEVVRNLKNHRSRPKPRNNTAVTKTNAPVVENNKGKSYILYKDKDI